MPNDRPVDARSRCPVKAQHWGSAVGGPLALMAVGVDHDEPRVTIGTGNSAAAWACSELASVVFMQQSIPRVVD